MKKMFLAGILLFSLFVLFAHAQNKLPPCKLSEVGCPAEVFNPIDNTRSHFVFLEPKELKYRYTLNGVTLLEKGRRVWQCAVCNLFDSRLFAGEGKKNYFKAISRLRPAYKYCFPADISDSQLAWSYDSEKEAGKYSIREKCTAGKDGSEKEATFIYNGKTCYGTFKCKSKAEVAKAAGQTTFGLLNKQKGEYVWDLAIPPNPEVAKITQESATYALLSNPDKNVNKLAESCVASIAQEGEHWQAEIESEGGIETNNLQKKIKYDPIKGGPTQVDKIVKTGEFFASLDRNNNFVFGVFNKEKRPVGNSDITNIAFNLNSAKCNFNVDLVEA